MKPFIFGLFKESNQIVDYLKPERVSNVSRGSIHSNGYTISSQPNRKLFFRSNIYNLEEVAHFTASSSMDIAGIVLKLYDLEGIKGFRRLNGKFIIIIQEQGKTIIARDRNGEGSTIYYTNDYFTDSYQALNDFTGFSNKPDLTGITTFLKIGYIPAPMTSLSGVNKIPAGEVLSVTEEGFRFEKLFPYDEITLTDRIKITENEAIEQYHELLKKSIRSRIGGAETVGVLLSGGYDSGGNLAILHEVNPRKIKTFSIGFKNNPASELPFARLMADKFSSEHQEYNMDGTEIEYLPEIIDCLGDPFSESGFMLNHSVMKLVSCENLPVVIGGDGNDQYWGAGIRETALHFTIQRSGLLPVLRSVDKITDNSYFDSDNFSFKFHFQNQKILKIMEPETFGFHDYQLDRMFDMKRIGHHPTYDEIPKKFRSYEELFLQRNYFLHLRHSVNEVILFKASRFSQYFNVNLAFSYADNDIYHFIRQLPLQLRAKGTVEECRKGKGVTKYVHKELVRPLLPQAVTHRAKQGGFSPLEIFFNDKSRREKIYRYIVQSEFAKTLKSKEFLQEIFMKYESLSSGHSYWFWYKQVKSNQLLNLLILTIWWDKIFNGKKTGKLSDYLD